MKISIVGSGTVGKATGEGLRRFGHEIAYYDRGDQRKDEKYHVTFFCVPDDELDKAFEKFSSKKDLVSVVRSTVKVGETERLHEKLGIHVCHNPEFLRGAVAEYEFLNPHKIVVGECCRKHGALLGRLYKPFQVPIIFVDRKTSELVKLASNAYLATLISFWNQIQMIAGDCGVNSHVVGNICSLDPRISGYGANMHGKAYGGSCLPKDLITLRKCAKLADTRFLRAVGKVNSLMTKSEDLRDLWKDNIERTLREMKGE